MIKLGWFLLIVACFWFTLGFLQAIIENIIKTFFGSKYYYENKGKK